MNNTRRKAIVSAMADFEKLQAQWEELKGALGDIKESLETIRDEEQESYDNMPESLQQSERAYTSEAALEQLQTAIDWFDAIDDIGDFDDVISALDSARE